MIVTDCSPTPAEVALDRAVGLSRTCEMHYQQNGMRPTHIAMSSQMFQRFFGAVPPTILGMTVMRMEKLGGHIAVFNYHKEKA